MNFSVKFFLRPAPKKKTIDIMMEYTGRSRNETEYAYNQFKRWTDRIPRRLSIRPSSTS
jgi:glycine betaine/choline ABC-type transport system substrate-binding protein